MTRTGLSVQQPEFYQKQAQSGLQEQIALLQGMMEDTSRELTRLNQRMVVVKKQAADHLLGSTQAEKSLEQARLRMTEMSGTAIASPEDISQAYAEVQRQEQKKILMQAKEEELLQARLSIQEEQQQLIRQKEETQSLLTRLNAALQCVEENQSTEDVFENTSKYAEIVIMTQEQERRRIARELHFGPVQDLARINFRIDICERFLDTDVERVRQELSILGAELHRTLTRLRDRVFSMRPLSLTEMGLASVIQQLLDLIRARAGIATQFYQSDAERRLLPYVESGLFRMAQEIISNAEKHAQPSLISVEIEFKEDVLYLRIQDDGKGFILPPDWEAQESNYRGLKRVKRKADLLKAEFQIQTAPGEGTLVTFILGAQ